MYLILARAFSAGHLNQIFIQASIHKQKSAIQKHAVSVKTKQKEAQTAALELRK